ARTRPETTRRYEATRIAIRNIEAQIWQLDRRSDCVRRARGGKGAENRGARHRVGASRKRDRECSRANEPCRRSAAEIARKSRAETIRKYPAPPARSRVSPI